MRLLLAIARQHLIISSEFKFGASTGTRHFAGYRARKISGMKVCELDSIHSKKNSNVNCCEIVMNLWVTLKARNFLKA
jgi:hypothetical protein